ncbi:MAG: NADH-quinone oxidoreductase, partial [Thermus sp.]
VHLRLSEFTRGLTPPPLLNHGTPFADLRIQERMPRRKERLALFAPFPTALGKWAGVYEVIEPGSERELLAALLGEKEGGEAARQAREAYEKAERPVLILGANLLQDAVAAERARLLAEKKGAKVLAMTPAANARGLEALGVLPKPGGAAWDEPGAEAAYYGYLPPEAALRGKRFLVFHLTHLHPLAEKYAHVVLPAETAYEKKGHVVNLEGRIQTLAPAPIDNGEADDAVAALALLAEALGVKPPFRLMAQAEKALPFKGGFVKERVKTLFPKEMKGEIYLRPFMWKEKQLVGRAAHIQPVLSVHPERAKRESLLEGAQVEVETPFGVAKARVEHREEVSPRFLYLTALGPYAGRRVEARILVPAGGEA